MLPFINIINYQNVLYKGLVLRLIKIYKAKDILITRGRSKKICIYIFMLAIMIVPHGSILSCFPDTMTKAEAKFPSVGRLIPI